MKVSKNAQNLQILKDIVGTEQFIVIAERLNGEHLTFNNHSCQGFISKDEQKAAIMKDYYHGMTWEELADKYGLTASALYKITEKV